MHTNVLTSQADSDACSTIATEPKPLQTIWWLYLLACKDGRTYIGITLDVAARFQIHATGKGAKFTRSNPPLNILGAQSFPDKPTALQAEYALKQLDKSAKLRWATQWPYDPGRRQ
jgi:putative endonuclease